MDDWSTIEDLLQQPAAGYHTQRDLHALLGACKSLEQRVASLEGPDEEMITLTISRPAAVMLCNELRVITEDPLAQEVHFEVWHQLARPEPGRGMDKEGS